MSSTVASRPLTERAGLARDRLMGRFSLPLPGLLVGGLAVWVWSLSHIDLAKVGYWGLPPALPPSWYVALAALVGGAGASTCARRPRGWLILAYVLAVGIVLYATLPAILHVPQYSWVYKHIGVTRYIELHGSTNPSIDIYNRWPAFFAAAAAYAQLAGLPNPVAFAGWAEPLFALIDAVLVIAIARALTRDVRISGASGLIFLFANWVGQTYYSPQAAAFTLSLAIVLVILRQFSHHGSTVGRRTIALAGWLVRRPQAAATAPKPLGWTTASTLAVVLGLNAVVIVTHQLTPYVLLMQVGALTLWGLVRPRWLVIVMGVMTVAFLLPNLRFVQENYGLFTSLNPLDNVVHSTLYGTSPVPGKTFHDHAGELLAGLVWISSLAAAMSLTRRGLGRTVLPVLLLAFTPFGVLLGQNYGGEAILRVVMFSAPCCSILIAWAIAAIRWRPGRVFAAVAVPLVLAALFVPSFSGTEEINLIPAGEVQAAEYIDSHVPHGASVLLDGPSFPRGLGPHYDDYIGGQGEDDPNLLSSPRTEPLEHRPLGPAQLPYVIHVMGQYPPGSLLVFSWSATEYADVFRLTPPGALGDLERAVASSPDFRIWYRSPDTRVYTFLKQSAAAFDGPPLPARPPAQAAPVDGPPLPTHPAAPTAPATLAGQPLLAARPAAPSDGLVRHQGSEAP